MKRGWRNDPAWIEHYRKRDEDRAQREFTRHKLAAELYMEAMKRGRAVKDAMRTHVWGKDDYV